MAASPLSFRWDEEFIARVDAARGAVPRSAFVRECVESVMRSGGRGSVVRAEPASRAPFEADGERAGREGPRKKSASAAPREDASLARARRTARTRTPAVAPAARARPMVRQPRPIVGKRAKRS